MKLLSHILTIFIGAGLMGCAPNAFSIAPPSNQNPEAPPPQSEPQPEADGPLSGFCSDLNFTGVNWPASLNDLEKNSLAIALSITGSFEGSDGWNNLTNNFDGQGLSLGLLNQTLGTGSLQPLLIKMRDRNLKKLTSIFSPAHLNSLLLMLSKWQKLQTLSANRQDQLARISPLDFEATDEDANFHSRLFLFSAESDSVAWAVNNLYIGNSFEKNWQRELQTMAATPEYVSIQIESALALHNHARDYLQRIAAHELRAYLLLFDLVVQNGNIYPQDFVAFDQFVGTHPTASPTDRLAKLVEIRLTHVKPQYVNDVRSRKMAIISGTGFVHGQTRRLPQEYCYNPSEALNY